MTRGFGRFLRRNTIALLALFLALGGTTYAASSAFPKNSVGSKQVINGSLQTLDMSKKARKALKGNRGLRGLRGAAGPQGPQGPQGAQGAQGSAGAAGQDLTYTTVLKPGQTLTGNWGVGSSAAVASQLGRVSFRPNLAAVIAASNVHYVAGASAANCPGHGQAAAGHLCIYEYFNAGMAYVQTNYSDRQDATYGFGAGREGFVIYMNSSVAGGNAWGSWAVTAPGASAASAGAPAAPPTKNSSGLTP
jgi:hypothetical protein